eukprot:33396-Eustigmatos_ZCMA.PRE.1
MLRGTVTSKLNPPEALNHDENRGSYVTSPKADGAGRVDIGVEERRYELALWWLWEPCQTQNMSLRHCVQPFCAPRLR